MVLHQITSEFQQIVCLSFMLSPSYFRHHRKEIKDH